MPDQTPPDRTQVQVGGPSVSAATAHGFPGVPGYEIFRELGRGGMGVVYEAKQLKLDRLVALKLMKADDPLNKARFLAEGQVIAAVKHPHVVEVYDFGESAAGPYIAMEYLTGGSLADSAKSGSTLTPWEVAGQIAKIASGVGAAHELGIVHRDLKPGNVLLASDGMPKVTDFGLAKRAASDLTQTQDAAGTPAYMAPEQARAMKFVGPPADVWSLGVMLYEALAGKRPFIADTDMELLIRIQNDTPTTLRTLTPRIPHDLETICLKCLEKESERRYASANELAADLTAWIEGHPIAARRATTLERAALWVRRKPFVAAAWALGTLAAVLAVSAVTTTRLWREAVGEKASAEGARDEAERAKKRAETAEGVANQAKADIAEERERLAYARNVYLAHTAYQVNDCRRANEFLALCPERLRGWDWRYVHRLCHSDLVTIKLPQTMVYSVALSPDGSRAAVAGSREGVGVWDVVTGKRVFPFAGYDSVRQVALSPDGTRVATAGDHGDVRVWDAKSGEQQLRTNKVPGSVLALTFGPAGLRALSGFETHRARFWGVETNAVLHTFSHSTQLGPNTFTSGNLRTGAISADGTRVLTGSADHTARLWDAKTGKELQTLRGHAEEVTAVAIAADGTRLVTASQDQTMRLWDAKTGKEVLAFKGATSELKSVAFSPDGSRVATGGRDMTVRVWGTKTGVEAFAFRGHTRDVESVAFTGDGKRIVSGSYDGTVKVWDATRGYEPRGPTGSNRYDQSVAFSPDGRHLASYRGAGVVLIWDLGTGTLTRTIEAGKGGGVYDFAGAVFSPDGTRMLTYSETADVWDAQTGANIFSLRSRGRRGLGITSAAFFPDGAKVVTAAGQQESGSEKNFTATVWDVKTDKELLTLRGHTKDVLSVAVSPDGSRIATSGNDLTTRMWDAKTGAQLFLVQEGAAGSLAFDRTGSRLLAGCADGAARVYDAATGAAGPTLRGHTWRLSAALFTPDGSRIVTGSWDKSIKVWDAMTGSEILTLTEPEGVTGLAISPDGSRIAVSGKPPRVYDDRPVSREFLPKAGAAEPSP
jgi:WD40 repeat protein